MTKTFQGVCYEGATVVLLARVKLSTDEYPIIEGADSDIDTITINVFRLDTDAQTYTASFDPFDVMYESTNLQTNRGWSEVDPDAGYNLAITLPGGEGTAAAIPDGSVSYRAEVIIVSTSGDYLVVVWQIDAIDVLSY